MTTDMRWQIFIADLNPVEGSEQGGTRPVIIISNEDFNQIMPVITILPVTALKDGSRIYPGEVLLSRGQANLERNSLVLAYQIRTISKKRLVRFIGSLANLETRRKIEDAVKSHLDFL